MLVSKLFRSEDARSVGGGNPGATNAWMAAGWKVGLIVLLLDVSKGIIPVVAGLLFIGPAQVNLDMCS